MLTIKQILDAVAEVVAEAFPGETVYFGVTPKDFEGPSALVKMANMTMEAEGGFTVSRTMSVAVTRFCAVDDENSQTEQLAADLTLLQSAFAQGVLTVGDRRLDIGVVSGKYENGHAELNIPLSWWDDNETQLPELPVIEKYKINGEETK